MREALWSRRTAMRAGAAVLLAGGGVMAMRDRDRGGPHAAYFEDLSDALRAAGVARPVLVIDRARLDANIAAARKTLDGTGLALRVVVKSLPAMGLIDAVAGGMLTDRFMVFNGPMLTEMVRAKPRASYLMGKPLAVAEAARTLTTLDPSVSPQWLIDTPARLQQFAELARDTGRPMQANLEIDVGLHRGGFADAASLAQAVDAARQAGVTVSGLMGYEPHIPKTPDPARAYTAAQTRYAEAKAMLGEKLGVEPATLTLNSAGSPTYAMHAKGTAANEVSVGSAFVKPTDFDIATLAHHAPAAFIATPVLKAMARTDIPSLEGLRGLFAFMDPNTQRAFYIHGGHWMAKPESPPGLEYSSLFGRSSNQELLTASAKVELRPDDYIFLRPTQSEAVFLQFGDIAVYENGAITGWWPTFPVSA